MADLLHDLYQTYMGTGTLQYWADFLLWEKLLNRFKDIRRIIELGTFVGGLSLFLKAQTIQRDIDFHTFDVKAPDLPYEGRLWHYLGLEADFEKGDIFGELAGRVDWLVHQTDGIAVVLCDNGDKRREYHRFAPVLRSGDIIAIHDWMDEIGPNGIDHKLTIPIMEDVCAELSSATRMLQRL